MEITLVAGARPNFMKVAPIIRAIDAFNRDTYGRDIQYRLVHTGQHYDKNLSQTFFEELGIPQPHNNLEVGSGTQAEQTAAIMVRFEQELSQHRPDVVLVVGDVTSTMACAIAAKKLCIDVAHVEAGIRSGDRTMPEEINRMVTDAISDHFFTTTEWAGKNLLREGAAPGRIHLVGNTMIDTLLANEDRLRPPALWREHALEERAYFVLTLHRPNNVDEEHRFQYLMREIARCAQGMPIVFPVHPRTAKVARNIFLNYPSLILTEPMGYLEFNYLVKYAKGVITDSGGITEETTVMGVPCLTLRNSTERPETVDIGTNELIGTDPAALEQPMKKILAGKWKKGDIPPLWDGRAARRIVRQLAEYYAYLEPKNERWSAQSHF
jgi:UDP-N-acetylglucosamine 2-epimerase (non-hydrolysing)